ncbi:Flp family type IVb pilin [Neomoorella carbonis]|jgi:Flp pilus assembly pilin Flp|uniref:Flp family type IVb pilin n=1 Tax=Neomoorella carbonis TaxID=3062783 RepID=UPI003247EB45
MLSLLKKIWRDEKGYEMAELLVIVGVLGVIATFVLGTMKLGLNNAATDVGNKVQGIVDSWTVQ